VTLTADQRELFDETWPGEVKVHEGQTPAQAKNVAVYSFRHVCAVEGVPIPNEEDVAAEIETRLGV